MEHIPPFISRVFHDPTNPKIKHLSEVLRKYDLEQTLGCIAGLLTDPTLQANAFRLELLAKLVLGTCRGRTKATPTHVMHWLNRQLGEHPFATMEDPPEDVFVGNVITENGDYLVLTGLWEAPDDATGLLIQTVQRHFPSQSEAWLAAPLALLKASDFILKRLGLRRWEMSGSTPKRLVNLQNPDTWKGIESRCLLTLSDLETAGINPEHLTAFELKEEFFEQVGKDIEEQSLLHSSPLVRFGEKILFTLVNSATMAARQHILAMAEADNKLQLLEELLMQEVMRKTMTFLSSASRHDVERIDYSDELMRVDNVCYSHLFRIGGRRFIHLIFLSDPLENAVKNGLLYPTELPEVKQNLLDLHLKNVQDKLENENEVDSAHSIAVVGHLGQPFAITFPEHRPRWTFDVARTHDLATILCGAKNEADKLVLLFEQRELFKAQGLHISNVNGLINLYAYWIDASYCLRAPEVPCSGPNLINLGTDYLTKFRADRRRMLDAHCELSPTGIREYVMRANFESVYETLRDLPIHVGVERLKQGRLSFCIPIPECIVWITVVANSRDREIRDVAYKLWEGIQLVVYRALTRAESPFYFSVKAVEVIVDASSLVGAQAARDNQSLHTKVDIRIHKSLPIAKVSLGPGFLREFSGVGNAGETKLLSYIIGSLRMLESGRHPEANEMAYEALEVLQGSEAKVFHIFAGARQIERLLSNFAKPDFQRPEEHIGAAMRSAFNWMPHKDHKVYMGLQESISVLNECVGIFARRVASKFKRFNKVKMVEHLLFQHETLIKDKQQWRSTARAVTSLYGAVDGTAAAERAERERAEASITLRALVECALCECPDNDGIAPDAYSVDELFGMMCTLINIARDSEVIYQKLSSKGITVYPSGAYAFEANILHSMGGAYVSASFNSGYKKAASEYESWIHSRESEEKLTGQFVSPEFAAAFKAEYAFDFPQLIAIVGGLMDVCVESQRVTVALSANDLRAVGEAKNISPEEMRKFLDSFSLQFRESWIPVAPVKAKDVEPWRFERRLSVMLRPLIECGLAESAKYVFGVGTLREAIAYVLESTTEGSFDKDVFRSKEMRSYIGRRVDESGRSFTELVASSMRDFGWQAKTEVKMSELGAGKNPNLGDVDVIAWSNNGNILAIECKRLKRSRSISEIAQSCARFAGTEGDHLHKHLRRVQWLKENLSALGRFAKVPPATINLVCPLVTSAEVPFGYLQNLPIPASDIVTFTGLDRYLLTAFGNR